MPEGPSGVRQFRVSHDRVRSWAGAAALVLATLTALSAGYFVKESERAKVDRLALENGLLAAEVAQLDGKLEVLESAVGELVEREESYRALARLEPLDAEATPTAEPEGPVAGLAAPGRVQLVRPRKLRRPAGLRSDLSFGASTIGAALIANGWSQAQGAGRTGATASARAAAPATADRGGLDLEMLIDRARRLAAKWDEAAPSFTRRPHHLAAVPSILPASGFLSRSFGSLEKHPLLLDSRPHEGIDIVAPEGTPVVAAAAGRVRFVGERSRFGLVVEVDHGNRYATRYAHLKRALVRPGQTVERGVRIGVIGQTGIAFGPHVHYEVLVDGRPRDPRAFILYDLPGDAPPS